MPIRSFVAFGLFFGSGCTEPDEEPLAVVSAVGTSDASLVNNVALEVSLDGEAALSVSCALATDPEEVHVVAGSTPAAEHALALYGLLAASTYECVAAASRGSTLAERAFTVTTGPLPPDLPEITVRDAGTPSGHYVVFNDGETDRVLIIDREGRYRWYRSLEVDTDQGVEAVVASKDVLLVGGGRGYDPSLVDIAGTRGWQAPPPPAGGVYHHEAAFGAGGEVLALSAAPNTAGGSEWVGFEITTWETTTDELTWSWNSQEAVDQGQLIAGSGDLYHANALAWVEDPDGPSVWVSLRAGNLIARVDQQTGELDWRLGVGQDFVLVDESGAPLDDSEWFYSPHAPVVDLPYVYVHDNGVGRPNGQQYSRVVQYELDVPARRATKVWEFRDEGWFEPFFGDVDLLPNGHVVVTEPNDPVFGADRPPILVEVDPATDARVWSIELGTTDDTVYRAELVDGCSLFANAKYCASAP